ncbi:hypothetical protein [Mucilaginibacter sp.]|uniref:hypothetical protein n=1 Tax=Mucilaginibacter sp. TaxID=1882438 RepID=UPI003D0E2F06
MKKIILITVTLVFIGLIIVFIRFVTGVTSISEPIRQYKYSGSLNQLVSCIKKYTLTDQNVSFEITDTTGNIKNGYAVYITIYLKDDLHNIEYGLKCKENNSNSGSINTIIKLVKAYDKSNNTGGYYIDGKGVKPLVNTFEVNFLVPLRNTQKLKSRLYNSLKAYSPAKPAGLFYA